MLSTIKINRVKRFALIAITALPTYNFAQDLRFSMNHETPSIINPALSCTAYDTRIIANYRDQWASVSSPFQSYGISLEKAVNRLKLKKSYIGTALNIFNDKAGDAGLNSLSVKLGVNVIVKTGKYSKLSGGIGGGIVYRTISPDNFKWESQFDGYKHDPTIQSGERNVGNTMLQGDIGAGLVYRYAKSEKYISSEDGTKFDLGFSAFHFNQPSYSFANTNDKMYMRYVGHANFDIGIKGAKIALMPSFVFMKQGPSQDITAGFMFKYIIKEQTMYTDIRKASAIAFGAFFRTGDAVAPALLFQWDKYALGFCYDLNISPLKTASNLNGALEVTLRFNTSPGYGRALGGSFNRPTYK